MKRKKNIGGTEKYYYLDVVKAIAFYLVILGHLVNYAEPLFNWIFSFHMMTFFFVSGYQFNPNKYPLFKKYFIRKVKTLIVPYFIVIVVAMVVHMVTGGSKLELSRLLRSIFVSMQPEQLNIGQVWFLICLFWTELLFYILYNKLFIKIHIIGVGICIAAFSLIGYFINGVIADLDIYEITNPWKIGSTMTAIVFYSIGYYCKKYRIWERLIKKIHPVFLFQLGLLFAFIGYQLSKKNDTVNICVCMYGNYLFFYAAAFTGIIAVLSIATVLNQVKILRFIGKNTLWMFCFHSFFLEGAVMILIKLTGFPYSRLENIPYNYCFIISIITYVLLAIIAYTIDYVKNLLLTHKPIGKES